MNEIADILERQTAWQRSRAGLIWIEKLRLGARLCVAAPVMGDPPPTTRRWESVSIAGSVWYPGIMNRIMS